MGPLTTGLLSVANSKVFCKLGNGTVADLTEIGGSTYVHPATKQCNYSVNIVNNLTTNSSTSALSAAQGVDLDARLSALENAIDPSRMQIITSYTTNVNAEITIEPTRNGVSNVLVGYPTSSFDISGISKVYVVVEYTLIYDDRALSYQYDSKLYVTLGYLSGGLYILNTRSSSDDANKREIGTFTQVLDVKNKRYYKNDVEIVQIPKVYTTYDCTRSDLRASINSGTKIVCTMYGR